MHLDRTCTPLCGARFPAENRQNFAANVAGVSIRCKEYEGWCHFLWLDRTFERRVCAVFCNLGWWFGNGCKGVQIGPGAIQFTRIRRSARFCASDLVNAWKARRQKVSSVTSLVELSAPAVEQIAKVYP